MMLAGNQTAETLASSNALKVLLDHLLSSRHFFNQASVSFNTAEGSFFCDSTRWHRLWHRPMIDANWRRWFENGGAGNQPEHEERRLQKNRTSIGQLNM
jgi:hypothetical protein